MEERRQGRGATSAAAVPVPAKNKKSKRKGLSAGQREERKVEVSQPLASVAKIRKSLPSSSVVGLGGKNDANVTKALGYLPGNALEVKSWDPDGLPASLELYPLIVRQVRVGLKDRNKAGAWGYEGDMGRKKRRRVGNQRGGANWNVKEGIDGWETCEGE